MPNDHQENFALFASNFVRNYWRTVKEGDFPMPPNEPVKETVEELLADISYTTQIRSESDHSGALYELRMTNQHEDWWRFGFHRTGQRWNLIECTARSDDATQPHDLLDPIYS